MKKPRRTKEEMLVEQLEKEDRKALRMAQKLLRDEEKNKPKEPKQEASEEDLVKKYAKRVIMNQSYHGRIDEKRFDGIMEGKTVNKNLFLDNDFFFSTVFQSQAQKMEFLEKSGMLAFIAENTTNATDGMRIQIVNGLEYARHLGIELKEESRGDYLTGNLDLMPFVLDNEEIEEN